MKKAIVFLVMLLAGCSSASDDYYTGLQMIQEYKETNDCKPVSFKLKDRDYQYCGRYGCREVVYQYYTIEYDCKGGKKLYTEIKSS